jgi:hypothetical protein
MSVEQAGERDVAPIRRRSRYNVIKNLSDAALEILLERRARQINEKVARIEESQKVTQETMNLEFTI